MPETKDNGQWVRSALRQETAEWTPQCPDPETLLDWLEQGDQHPEAKPLLAHLFACAHCRQERIALREIRVLSGVTHHEAASQLDPAILGGLPAKVGRWVRELIVEGRVAPVASVRAALDRLQGSALALRGLEAPAVAKGQITPSDLRPARAAVRCGRPILRWSAGSPAREYEIAILRPVGSELRSAWEGKASSSLQLTLPEEVDLKPGRYLWQVVALTDDGKVPSKMVGFVVLKEALRQEIESLERKIETTSPLARIGLYEAYGLYEDALQTAETLMQLNADDETARRIHTQLLSGFSLTTEM